MGHLGEAAGSLVLVVGTSLEERHKACQGIQDLEDPEEVDRHDPSQQEEDGRTARIAGADRGAVRKEGRLVGDHAVGGHAAGDLGVVAELVDSGSHLGHWLEEVDFRSRSRYVSKIFSI